MSRWYPGSVPDDLLTPLAESIWALPALALLVVGDAFLVLVPGEAAVSAFGALAAVTGSPPLLAVIAVAGAAAFVGDLACYLLGRTVGLQRWRWMRGPRVQRAFAWAAARLHRNAAVIVFTARFIPFARLALNLTAGATRLPPRRYLPVVALAAFAWAAYQSVVGAVVAWLLPGAPALAVVVSIAVALTLGLALDALAARRSRSRP